YAPYDVNPNHGSWADPGFVERFVERVFDVIHEYDPDFANSVLHKDRAINTTVRSPGIERDVPMTPELLAYGEATRGNGGVNLDDVSDPAALAADAKRAVSDFREAWTQE
ncbi:Pyridine nucleotide-disulfide oxidoreductase domain-containing protein 2, partial [Perkinsus olseni]